MLVEDLLTSAGRGHAATVSDPSQTLDYPGLARLADALREEVRRRTDRPHVGLMMPSSCAFAASLYGILWAGRTAVPLNFLLQPAELAAVIEDAGLDTVLTIGHFKAALAPLPLRAVCLEECGLSEKLAAGPAAGLPAPPQVAADDTAVLLYTSGTSGKPKGVCQTYRNLRSDVDGAIEKARLKREHRFLGVLPLSHSFGLTAMTLAPVRLGAAVHYLPRFNPRQVLETVRTQQSSVTMMIASMYAALLGVKQGGPEDLASLEYAVSGGEALSPAVHAAFKSKYKVDLLEGYGMTEASPVVSLNIPGSNRVGTVGQAIPGVTVTAFDDAGRPLPAGRTGELWVRGPTVMKGYYRKPEETSAVLSADGWYKTGDMGVLDADGYIAITGRKKEMIIVGGENVYPREIEQVLDQHPAVAESAVIGRADGSRGEVVVAFVTLREGSAAGEIELRDFCRERIAGYKVPRQVVIAADLPRGPTGKILKRKLHELL